MNLAQLLLRTARLHPATDAVFVGTRPHATYGELARRAGAIAGHLARQGLLPGDRLALFALPKSIQRVAGILYG
jgi:long-chain acyl-CoA synthetase